MAKLRDPRAPAAVAERVGVSAADQKILFALSGNVCAFPECNRRLVEPATAHDDAAVIGHIAHIVGASRQGPRGAEGLSDAQRAVHINLILLCRDHHAIVDAQPRTYSVQVLRQMKRDHEARIAKLTQSGLEALQPTLVRETLYSSLLPVTHLPAAIFHAPTSYTDLQYESVKTSKLKYPRDTSVLVPFLLREGKLFTFYDIRRKFNPFVSVINGPVERMDAEMWWRDPEGARRYQTLLNRMLHKWMGRRGVRYDPEHYRYFFEPTKVGEPRELAYRLQTGARSSRNVVWQPITRATGEPKKHWIHLAAGLSFVQVSPKQWCLAIRPERRITKDGQEPLESKRIGRRVTRLKAKMYNDKYLGELYFWLSVLTDQRPRVTLKLGGQSALIDARLVPFDIQWPGVTHDLPARTVEPVEDDLFSIADLDEALAGGEADEFEEDDEEGE
jgi:hypothetical protein